MRSKHIQKQEDVYFRVLRMLNENPDLTQRELAKKLEVSLGSLNYCMMALIEKGWIKVQKFSQSKNKFGYIYILTPEGIAEKTALTSNFLMRKLVEYDLIKAEIESLNFEFNNKQIQVGGEARHKINAAPP